MRPTFLIVATIAYVTCTPMVFAENPNGTNHQSTEQAAMIDCDANQTNMNLCSDGRYKQLDDELNNLYKKQLTRLKGTQDAKRLIDAERAWLKYIEADCLYQNGPREVSGSIWTLKQNMCLSHHLEQRIELLKSFLDCVEAECPGGN